MLELWRLECQEHMVEEVIVLWFRSFLFYSGNSWTGEVKCHLVITSVNPKDCQFSSQKLYVWSMWSHQSLIVLLLRAHEKQSEVPCMAKSRIPGSSVSLIIWPVIQNKGGETETKLNSDKGTMKSILEHGFPMLHRIMIYDYK